MLSQIPHSDAIKRLQSDLHHAISTQSRLMEDITELLPPPEQSHAIERLIMKKQLPKAVSNESSLQQEVKTLKASLAQARYDHKAILTKSLAEPSLKQEVAALKRSLAQAVSSETSLKHEVETLKTTLTHALSSERDMRASARQTREEWEKVERTLREEINTLKYDMERMRKELKGKKVVPFIQRLVLRTGVHDAAQFGGSQQDEQYEEPGYVFYLLFSHDLTSSLQNSSSTLECSCVIRRSCSPTFRES